MLHGGVNNLIAATVEMFEEVLTTSFRRRENDAHGFATKHLIAATQVPAGEPAGRQRYAEQSDSSHHHLGLPKSPKRVLPPHSFRICVCL